MTATIRIDMVADVTCPWSAIGLFSLLKTLRTLEGDLRADLHLQPLELHPGLGTEGVNRNNHLRQVQATQRPGPQLCWADIRLHGMAVGLDMGANEDRMLYNTLDAHRLLQWAHSHGPHYQLDLALGLARAYFTHYAAIADHQVLADLAAAAGLSRNQALAYLASSEDAQAVREAESFYRGMGIQTAPTFIFNHRQLLRGSQTPEGFARALRHVVPTDTPSAIY